MTNAEYWKQRFTQLEAAQNRKGATAYLEMEKQYKAAQNELEAQIARWYQRFADSNSISLAQAKQWLKGQDLADNPKASLLFFFMLQMVGAIAGFWSKDLLTPEVFTLFGWGVPSFVVGLFAGMKAWDMLKKHRINYHGIVHGFLLCVGSFILFRQLFLH